MKEFLSNLKFNFANSLAFLIVVLIFSYFFYISSNAFPPTLIKEISDIKIALITILTGITGYFFGSSSSSKKNKELLDKALEKE